MSSECPKCGSEDLRVDPISRFRLAPLARGGLGTLALDAVQEGGSIEAPG